MTNYIRFDWAIKKMLRNKANFGVLEGFMESLLGRSFKIKRFLESESNQLDENDKFCRVDILAEDESGSLYIFEVQNNHEISYFHRMLYGASKAIIDYINLGDDYDKVKKIYSINILYFELGQGNDYVYHGYTTFRGLHDQNDVLQLTEKQRKNYFGLETASLIGEGCVSVYDAGLLFPEYYVLRINDYDKESCTSLDEWISFLKTGDIDPSFTAPGMAQARECLDYDNLSEEEKRSYDRHRENERYRRSVLSTNREEGFDEGFGEGYDKGYGKGVLSIAQNLMAAGQTDEFISRVTQVPLLDVKSLRGELNEG